MAKLPGIVRYNRIRSALSKDLKSRGIKLESGGFDKINNNIFRTTREDPLKMVTSNIDELARSFREGEVPPVWVPTKSELIELGGAVPYWDVNRFPYETFPKELLLRSPGIMGKNVFNKDYNYDIDAKGMVQWVDNNRDPKGQDKTKKFGGTDQVPYVRLVGQKYDPKLKGFPAKFNYKTLSWEFELAFCSPGGDLKDDKGRPYDYGYHPGISPEYAPPEEIEGVEPEEREAVRPGPPPKEIEAEIKLKEAETHRLEMEVKLRQAEAAIEREKKEAIKERRALIAELKELGFTKEEIKTELAKL